MAAFFTEPVVVGRNRGIALGTGSVRHQLILTHGRICQAMSVYFVSGTLVPQEPQNLALAESPPPHNAQNRGRLDP